MSRENFGNHPLLTTTTYLLSFVIERQFYIVRYEKALSTYFAPFILHRYLHINISEIPKSSRERLKVTPTKMFSALNGEF